MSEQASNIDYPVNSETNAKNMAKMPAATLAPASPFLLRAQDVELLAQSDGFAILREHLSHHYNFEPCEDHEPANLEDASRWLIIRDVLHALLVPVVELFDKATSVAEQATHAQKIEDLEYAYTGDGRGAFLWLQCFLEKERDWTFTHGCPACVVEHSLDSEFTIRLLYAAILLSDVHYPFTLDGPKLPSFRFFLESLQYALEGDSLWGEGFFERMQTKAMQTRDGIEDLIRQCLQLDAILSAPPSPSLEDGSDEQLSPILAPIGGTPNMKVKRSKMARRQMKLKVEEEQWMEAMIQQCWDELQPMSAASMVTPRTNSIDAILKSEAVVAVAEVSPED